jgi:DNA end-binding protein Ku
MKPIWTGAIGFGLVNIPVKLYSATITSNIDLEMLDKNDHSKIHFKRINEKTGKEVHWENIVKGYKMPNEEYVVLTDNDFENANSKKTKTIGITNFVDENEIESIYYETPYYIEPVESGVRAYALLRDALRKTQKVGIATFVLRNKETLAILKAMDNVLVLNRIRFEEEIRNPSELNLPSKTDIKGNELKMAVTLIEQLSGKFNIKQYKNTYTAELMKVIKAKSKGIKIKTPGLKVSYSKTKDLMAQLKASLNSNHKKAS